MEFKIVQHSDRWIVIEPKFSDMDDWPKFFDSRKSALRYIADQSQFIYERYDELYPPRDEQAEHVAYLKSVDARLFK